MKRSYRVYAILLILVAMVAPIVASSSVSAAARQPAGFTVTPGLLSFTVTSGGASQVTTLVITNSYAASLNLVAEIRAIDESSARLVPTGPVDETLAQAIKLSATDITVPAQGSYQLQVAVDGTVLGDGGHYASLVLTQRSTSTATTGFVSAVAVNMFIIKNENIRTNLQLIDFGTNRTIFTRPTSASITFRNLGNTHVVPRASVGIYDGQVLVAKSVINTSSAPLFPDRQAKFMAPFETYDNSLLPRKLHMSILYRIDGSDIQLMAGQTFWYIPLIDVIVVVVLGALLWWYRRQLRWLTAIIVKRARTIPHRNDVKKTRKSSVAPRATTKRILGRTVIRTHQAVSRLAVKPTPRLTATHKAPAVHGQSNHKHIIVTTAEEATTLAKQTVEPQKAKKPVSTLTSTPKIVSKRPKTAKTASKDTAKPATAKTSKKTTKTSPKKAIPKTKKPVSQSKRKKAA